MARISLNLLSILQTLKLKQEYIMMLKLNTLALVALGFVLIAIAAPVKDIVREASPDPAPDYSDYGSYPPPPGGYKDYPPPAGGYKDYPPPAGGYGSYGSYKE